MTRGVRHLLQGAGLVDSGLYLWRAALRTDLQGKGWSIAEQKLGGVFAIAASTFLTRLNIFRKRKRGKIKSPAGAMDCRLDGIQRIDPAWKMSS